MGKTNTLAGEVTTFDLHLISVVQRSLRFFSLLEELSHVRKSSLTPFIQKTRATHYLETQDQTVPLSLFNWENLAYLYKYCTFASILFSTYSKIGILLQTVLYAHLYIMMPLIYTSLYSYPVPLMLMKLTQF